MMLLKLFFARFFEGLKRISAKPLVQFSRATKFKVTVIPQTTSLASRQYSGGAIALALTVYTLFIAAFTLVMIYYTPLPDILGMPVGSMTGKQKQQLAQLDAQLLYLSREFAKLEQSNKLLREAIEKNDSAGIAEKIKKTAPRGITTARSFNFFAALQNWVSSLLQEGENRLEFHSPARGFLSNKFNPPAGHYGIDFSIEQGSPVFAVAGGYVIFADYTTDDGNMLILGHRDGYVSVYKHCAKLLKRARQRVSPGETVALSGNSGRLTTAAHLHFELWKNGTPLDPEKYLFIR